MSTQATPYVETWCEGTTPGGWRCASLIQEDGDLLEEIEEEYGLLLCGDCQDDADNGNTPHDEETRKEAAWEWVNNR